MKFNNKKEIQVGDFVRIKSENWYYENRSKSDHVINLPPVFTRQMVVNCGKRFRIRQVLDLRVDDVIRYYLDDDTNYYYRAEYFE